MRVTRLAIGLCALLASCATIGGGRQPGASRAEYVNAEWRFAFRVPGGWVAAKSMNPFRSPLHLVRFDAPGGEAGVVAHRVEVGGRSCTEAANARLGEEGMRLRAEKPFTIRTAQGELPAWQATLESQDGGSRGSVSLFCSGGNAIVVAAFARTEAYGAFADEIAAVIDSFTYRAGSELVQVAPAAAPPPPPNYFVHVVRWRGQTLGRIAEWYTGRYDNWRKIAPLNDLSVPNASLKVGREVKIPPEMVVRRRALPQPRAQAPAAPRPAQGGTTAQPQAEEPPSAPAGEAEGEEEAPPLPPVIGPK